MNKVYHILSLLGLSHTSDAVRKMFLHLAQCSFTGFPNLLKTAKAKIEAIKQAREPTAESMIRTQFKMEMLVYSQDRMYSSSLSDRKKEMTEEEGRESPQLSVSFVFHSNNNTTLQELMLHLKSYYKIASQRLADQIPLVIRYQMLQESAVQLQSEMLQMLHDKENLEFFLKEDMDIGSKRAALQSRHKRLMKARTYLVEF
ncbi:interferon-induced GTP-binding protein Mx-like isoform X1 [Betta splendens]|uniref:Interferon-induced GTP-binding protein Mx-like isoform X1 n=2 Tax=Betta splendens TaxID=158456 RepID=A0A6P7MG34_BETSP|nr:interferon-induced GTP-binding protein Mx-like isoform X1 [Betta splendens]